MVSQIVDEAAERSHRALDKGIADHSQLHGGKTGMGKTNFLALAVVFRFSDIRAFSAEIESVPLLFRHVPVIKQVLPIEVKQHR